MLNSSGVSYIDWRNFILDIHNQSPKLEKWLGPLVWGTKFCEEERPMQAMVDGYYYRGNGYVWTDFKLFCSIPYNFWFFFFFKNRNSFCLDLGGGYIIM